MRKEKILQSVDLRIPLTTDPSEFLCPLRLAFERMRTAVSKHPYPSWEERYVRLEQLEQLVVTHRAEIAEAICSDFGHRSALQTDMLDVLPLLTHIRNLRENIRDWMKVQKGSADMAFLPAKTALLPQPKGIVGVISPWNYPLLLSLGPAATAIAAGNICMIKVSETTPGFASLLAELVSKYFVPEDLTVITGDAETGKRFCALPFDHLVFTGSPAVARKVMESAARNLTPLTLELGGKSPALIAPGYSLEHAAERIMYAKLLNAGQTCIAPDYVLVEKRHLARLVNLLQKAGRKFYPKGINDEEYTSIVSIKHFENLLHTLDDASRTALFEPVFKGDQIDIEKRKIAPHIVIEPSLTGELMKNEIFAPILPVISYPDDRMDQAVEFINARPHPLALYLFDNDQESVRKVMRETKSGGVTVNDTLWHAAQSNLPFGGIGNSGMGTWTGKVGFDAMSHHKPVFYQSKLSPISMLNPPYTEKFKAFLESQISAGSLAKTKEGLQLLRQKTAGFFAGLRGKDDML